MRPLAFCCILFSLSLLAATNNQDWKPGKVTADSSISGTSSAKYVSPRHPAIDPHILLIKGDDFIYTVREKHAWNGWCLLIQGDEIKYAQVSNSLNVIDATGQKCSLDILSQQKRP